MEVNMRRFLTVALIITGVTCFAQNAVQRTQTVSAAAENRRIATTLPARVIDPRTYQNTTANIRYVDTKALIEYGRKILEYNNGKPNSSGYTPHYDPDLHRDVYMRIPTSGKSIYGKRW